MLRKYANLRINNKNVTVSKGKNLLEVLQYEGIQTANYCMGKGTCGKCKVQVTGTFSALTSLEIKQLTKQEQNDGIRLACQVIVEGDGIVLTESETMSIIVEEGKTLEKTKKISLPISCYELSETIDIRGKSLVERFLYQFGDSNVKLIALQKIAVLDNAQNHVVLMRDGEIIDCLQKVTGPKFYGVAFDIGTTTLVAYLIELMTGREIRTVSRLNPQKLYGDDVISRIKYCEETKGLEKLHDVIVQAANEMISELCQLENISQNDIYACTIVGNPTMCQLFLKIDPRSIGRSPYLPAYRQGLTLSARLCGLLINAEGKIHALPNISGYIGSDTVAGILASKLYKARKPCVLIDVGTNGEIAVAGPNNILVCSAAAGPVFEGGGIRLGMRATEGAVYAVGDNGLSIIGDKPARGFCGSGIIDAIAYLLNNNIIDHKGVFKKDLPLESVNNLAAYYFNDAVYVTQEDIRKVQLAKSAIFTALELAIDKAGLNLEQIDKIYVAGSFGSNLNLHSAIRIGLLPDIDQKKFLQIGNSAGTGAKMGLIDLKSRLTAEKIKDWAEHFELASNQVFQKKFIENLYFPKIIKIDWRRSMCKK